MNKIIGYILTTIGLAGLIVSSIPGLPAQLGVPTILVNEQAFIIYVGIALIGVVFMLRNRKGKQPSEVPIYHGKNIVGYRLMK